MSVKEVHEKLVTCDICGGRVCSVSMGSPAYQTFPDDSDKAKHLFRLPVVEYTGLSGGFEHYFKPQEPVELWLCDECKRRLPKVEPPHYPSSTRYKWHEEPAMRGKSDNS